MHTATTLPSPPLTRPFLKIRSSPSPRSRVRRTASTCSRPSARSGVPAAERPSPFSECRLARPYQYGPHSGPRSRVSTLSWWPYKKPCTKSLSSSSDSVTPPASTTSPALSPLLLLFPFSMHGMRLSLTPLPPLPAYP